MLKTFRPWNPKQGLLLPPSLMEWLPEGHLALFILEVVEELDLRAIYASYEGDLRGQPPYEPKMMAAVLLYAYATGVMSSRRIERVQKEEARLREKVKMLLARAESVDTEEDALYGKRRRGDELPEELRREQSTSGRGPAKPQGGTRGGWHSNAEGATERHGP